MLSYFNGPVRSLCEIAGDYVNTYIPSPTPVASATPIPIDCCQISPVDPACAYGAYAFQVIQMLNCYSYPATYYNSSFPVYVEEGDCLVNELKLMHPLIAVSSTHAVIVMGYDYPYGDDCTNPRIYWWDPGISSGVQLYAEFEDFKNSFDLQGFIYNLYYVGGGTDEY
jgi:hypothetical protein